MSKKKKKRRAQHKRQIDTTDNAKNKRSENAKPQETEIEEPKDSEKQVHEIEEPEDSEKPEFEIEEPEKSEKPEPEIEEPEDSEKQVHEIEEPEESEKPEPEIKEPEKSEKPELEIEEPKEFETIKEKIEEKFEEKLENFDKRLKKEIQDDVLEERLIYLDLLRIIATIGVIILHIASKDWWNVNDYRSDDWNAYNIWDSLTRWTVPIFVMISGALFLDNSRRITVKMLWSQNILRIFAAFLVWSLIYTVYDVCNMEGDFGIRLASVSDVHRIFLDGYYHLWYMYMIIGLYILVPLLRKISGNIYLVRYFLIVAMFFTFLFPNIKNIGNLDIYYNYGNSTYLEWYENFDINMVTGYIAYFFLGYYLLKTDFTKGQRIVIYLLALGGFAATMVVTAGLYRISDFPNTIFYGNFSINVMLESIGIFVFAKNLKWKPAVRAERRLIKLSSITFGIYLVHALVLDVLIEQLGLSLSEFGNMYLAIPALAVDVLLISSVISYLLGRVPLIRKYAV